jgi:hypothetical protein
MKRITNELKVWLDEVLINFSVLNYLGFYSVFYQTVIQVLYNFFKNGEISFNFFFPRCQLRFYISF